MTTVVHCKKSEYDIYIGRPSKWGNPFSWLPNTLAQYRVSDRQESLSKYREYVLNSPELIGSLPDLKDKVLGCWCNPLPCHGDILIELIESSRSHSGQNGIY